MQHVALLERCPQRSMQAVLEVQIAAPPHDVGEQVPVEGGVVVQQRIQLEGGLGRDQFVEAHLGGWDVSPPSRVEAVGGVRPLVPHALEDHVRDYNEVTRAA